METPKSPRKVPKRPSSLLAPAKADALRARGENPFANDSSPAPLGCAAAICAHVSPRRALPRASTTPAKVPSSRRRRPVHVAGRVRRGARLRQGELSSACAIGRARCSSSAAATRSASDFARLDEIEVADFVEAEGVPMVTKHRRAVARAHVDPPSYQGAASASRKVARPHRRRAALPPSLRRPRWPTPRSRACSRRARSSCASSGATSTTSAFSRSRRPRCTRSSAAPRPSPSSPTTTRSICSLFMRIAPELYLKRLVVGGLRARVRDRALLPQRRHLDPAQPRVHDARVLPRVRDVRDAHGHDRGHAPHRRRAARRRRCPKRTRAGRRARPFTFDEPFARVPMRDRGRRGAREGRASAPTVPERRFASGDRSASRSGRRSPRAKKIDWSNFRKAMAKVRERRRGALRALRVPGRAVHPDDYRAADGTKKPARLHHRLPFEVSPLARRKDTDPSLVDRFELSSHGRELCNAFSELNDPVDQAARFRDQVERRRGRRRGDGLRRGLRPRARARMPPTAGFGMGIDRLAMMLTGQPSIRDVILFPLLRPENALSRRASASRESHRIGGARSRRHVALASAGSRARLGVAHARAGLAREPPAGAARISCSSSSTRSSATAAGGDRGVVRSSCLCRGAHALDLRSPRGAQLSLVRRRRATCAPSKSGFLTVISVLVDLRRRGELVRALRGHLASWAASARI